MHFELDDEQQAIRDAVARILEGHAGPARARALGGDAPRYDAELADLLRSEGYLGFALDEVAGPVTASIVVEEAARSCAVAPIAAEALVVPGALSGERLAGPVAVARRSTTAPVRFAGDAATLVAVGDDDVTVVALDRGSTTPASTRFGYPMATVDRWDGRSLGAGSADGVLAWWRLALALELVGTARAALDLTVEYVGARKQFGRALGSFQALQHRLAECEVLVQGARWLAMEAAWARAEPERVAAALVQALRAAERTFWDTHQFSGALGFATEYDLHLWTMRLPALRAEALALGSPAAALTVERWSESVA